MNTTASPFGCASPSNLFCLGGASEPCSATAKPQASSIGRLRATHAFAKQRFTNPSRVTPNPIALSAASRAPVQSPSSVQSTARMAQAAPILGSSLVANSILPFAPSSCPALACRTPAFRWRRASPGKTWRGLEQQIEGGIEVAAPARPHRLHDQAGAPDELVRIRRPRLSRPFAHGWVQLAAEFPGGLPQRAGQPRVGSSQSIAAKHRERADGLTSKVGMTIRPFVTWLGVSPLPMPPMC